MKLIKTNTGFGVYLDEDWENYKTLLKDINTEIGVGWNRWCNGQDFLDCITVTDIEEAELKVLEKLLLGFDNCDDNIFGDFPDLEDEINYWNEFDIDEDDEEE